MASTNQVNVLNVCKVTPSLDSPESSTELSLPLTFFDTMWFKFHPVERIFFYKLTELTTALFNSVILPKLRHSLSLALLHFLPLSGNLKWPPHAAKPIILYTPNDGVSLIVAESNADLDHLSGNTTREAVESRPYVPHLHVSDSAASIVALQITLFPNQGFCIGISAHHGILDGKSSTMFIKAWAHICKHTKNEEYTNSILPSELTPVFDRTVIQDPEELDMVYLNNWLGLKWPGQDPNPRSLKLVPDTPTPTNLVRATFEFSREDIKNLRERVLFQLDKVPQEDPKATESIHLSTFVLTFAYTLVCIVKAKGLASDRKICFGFIADCRTRLDPPIPTNYFGNCVTGRIIFTEAQTLMEENGVSFVARKLSEVIKRLEKRAFEGAKDLLAKFFATEPGTAEIFGVAGSTQFKVYGSDFGWGKPTKVEVVSIDRAGNTTCSMAESKDGGGGVEVGIVLKKHEMDMFQSLFVNGLKDQARPINRGFSP